MKNRHQGFVLITFIALFMTSFAVVWLMHLANLHRQQQEFDDRFQYQLHQARMQLFWQATKKPFEQSWLSWQTSFELQQWLNELEQSGLAADIEIEPLQLVVDLHSVSQANKFSQRLVHSTAHGTRLKLALPDTEEQQEQSMWLYRQTKPGLEMATNLSGGNHLLSNVDELRGAEAYLQSLQTSDLQVIETTTDKLVTPQLNNSVEFSVGHVMASTMHSHEVFAEQGHMQRGLSNKLTAQAVNSESALANSAATQSSTFQTLATSHIAVEQPVHLSGTAADRVNALNSQLAGLEQSIYRCIHETLWCLAPVAPQAILTECLNCQNEQQNSYFEAVVIIDVGVCIHGCGVRVRAPTGVALSCPVQAVPAGHQGKLRCQAASTLVGVDELAFNLQIEVYSGKKTTLYTQLTAPIHWQISVQPCAAVNHTVTVAQSAPTMNYTLSLPSHPGGEAYSWRGTIYQECRASGQGTFMRCDLAASCSTSGQWQRIMGRCSCMGW